MSDKNWTDLFPSGETEDARIWYDRARPLLTAQLRAGPAQWEELRVAIDALPVRFTGDDLREVLASIVGATERDDGRWEIADRREKWPNVTRRAITREDEADVRARVGRAIAIDPDGVALGWGPWGLASIHGAPGSSFPGIYSSHAYAELAKVGLRQGAKGWEIVSVETAEEPAFPTDAGVERPEPPGWHPCWHVPDDVTCPLCDTPVIPCDVLNPAGPPCAHARWKPGATTRGVLYAHVECIGAHESNDTVARAYREWEECAGLETRAWEQARMATELRIRSEQAYRDAMKGSGK